MKIQIVKQAGGILCPASDMELEKLNKFKTGEHYEISIKLSRNPAFLRKVMVFLGFVLIIGMEMMFTNTVPKKNSSTDLERILRYFLDFMCKQ